MPKTVGIHVAFINTKRTGEFMKLTKSFIFGLFLIASLQVLSGCASDSAVSETAGLDNGQPFFPTETGTTTTPTTTTPPPAPSPKLKETLSRIVPYSFAKLQTCITTALNKIYKTCPPNIPAGLCDAPMQVATPYPQIKTEFVTCAMNVVAQEQIYMQRFGQQARYQQLIFAINQVLNALPR